MKKRSILVVIALTLAAVFEMTLITDVPANALTSVIDVTVKNNGTGKSDPWTLKTQKDDNEGNFYVSVHTLSGTSTIFFSSWDANGRQVSEVYGYGICTSVARPYRQAYGSYMASAGNSYRLLASTQGVSKSVHAIGYYTP